MTPLAFRAVLFFFAPLILFSSCNTELELVWQQEFGYRWAQLRDWDGSKAGFEEVSSSRTGISFVNTLDEESLVRNRHYMNGSGVAIGDVDGDGWVDLYFARMDGPNALYRNLGGWRFDEITERAGVAAPDRYSTGAVFADIDGDGDLDLLLTAMGGPNAAYLNDGLGQFTEITEEAGLASNLGGTTMTLADIEGDGDLDLYVSNYKVRAVNDVYPPSEHSFERTVVRDGDEYRIAPEFERHYELVTHAGGLLRVERAEPNRFYINNGEGRFTNVPLTGGTFRDKDGKALATVPEDWTLTARFQDANGDGAPDLYICNDFQSPDYFWMGDGRGTFRAVSPLALRKTSFSTMSVDFSDIERDGDLDFFLTDMLSRDHVRRQTQVGLTIPMTTAPGEIENRPQAMQNTLQLNRGDGTYAEIAHLSGVAASDWTWSGLFLDVDFDGYEDVLLATGHLHDVIDKDAQMREIFGQSSPSEPDAFHRQILEYPPLPLKNVAFRNRGDLQFDFVEDGWGIGRRADVSNALAFGDLDNDGDLDAVVNRVNDTAGLFRNDASAPRLAVRLRGEPPNTQAIGAKIRVSAGGLPDQEKEVVSGGIYLSGSDPLSTFAAGDPDKLLSIEIIWRSGRRTRIDSIGANRIIEIAEETAKQDSVAVLPVAQNEVLPENGAANSLFEEASLPHKHGAASIDDRQQPLLRKLLSRPGPGLAWSDVDRDADDDLFIADSAGVSLYRNDGGSLVDLRTQLLDGSGDVAGIATSPTTDGARVFVAANALSAADSSWIHVLDVGSTGHVTASSRLPFEKGSIGPLALADVDGDGDLDLFAGGRVTPGSYPDAPPSQIYINQAGEYRVDATLSEPFRGSGVVSGAAFGDLDGDADQDVLLATEWGPIRYFENQGVGRFVERTSEIGLDLFTGWWNGVALGDFDADGRLDVVATNWGWNTEHERLHQSDQPIRLYVGDFNTDGRTDALEAIYRPDLEDYAPLQGLNALSDAMPYVSQRIPTYQQYARSSLRDIIGFRLDQAEIREANTLSHILFLNRANGSSIARFEAVSLPEPAQFTVAFAPVVGDFDGDGAEDLFLSQNFFAYQMEVPRQDAGRGLLLLGDGNGGFEPVQGQDSGIEVYGEQRGAAAADVDGDGRLDLAVTQHGAESRLYRNATAPAGLRVRLTGPTGNRSAVGSVLRLQNEDGSEGPARLVSAGSGYWSQNSPIQVVSSAPNRQAKAVRVRWPDGTETIAPIPPGARLIVVEYDRPGA